MEGNTQYLIPRTIHYFWLGGKPKTQAVIKCIESWKKYCPDFEIKEWNEENYDVHKHPYMEKAYREKKWAFVTDYGRLDVLYQYGGIYMDTDVEVIKNLSPMCRYKAFTGFENVESINDGQGFGCVSGMPILKEMMACYDGDEPYETVDGVEYYMESPRRCTKVLLRHGLIQNGKRQSVAGIEIFPSDYFCPLDYDTGQLKITENTYSIHHFEASWHDEKARHYNVLRQRLNRLFGKKIGKLLFGFLIHFKDAFKMMIGR